MTSKLASLHAGLVARKGEAMPSVSHQMFSYVDRQYPPAGTEDASRPAPGAHEVSYIAERREPVAHHDLPDIPAPDFRSPERRFLDTHAPVETADSDTSAFEADAILDAEPPMVPEHKQAVDLRDDEPEVVSYAAPDTKEPAAGSSDDADTDLRHRLTFRLSHTQRHRLRLAAAIKDTSLQSVLSEALDNHLDGLCACSLKDCSCMAAADVPSQPQ